MIFFRPLGPKSPYSFYKRYRCHHNTRHAAADPSSGRRRKNTECPFSMTIRVFDVSKTPRQHPCWVALQWFHNHPLHSLEVNTFRSILPETAEKVKGYFDSGFSPGIEFSGAVRMPWGEYGARCLAYQCF